MYEILADIVLIVHAGFVLLIGGCLPVIFLGRYLGWHWVGNGWFRVLHLVGIGIVVAQAWAGILCPLTTLEIWLRQKSGLAFYDGGFVQHWVQRALYYDAPPAVFAVAYTVFGLLVLLAWRVVPPRLGTKS